VKGIKMPQRAKGKTQEYAEHVKLSCDKIFEEKYKI